MCVGAAWSLLGQPGAANYDEAKILTYTLPDPLLCTDGTRVMNVKAWEKKRRTELLRLFEEQVYGRAPGKPRGMKFEVASLATNALAGQAIRKEITIGSAVKSTVQT